MLQLKKIILFALLIAMTIPTNVLMAQKERNNGYFGFSLGPSYALGTYKDSEESGFGMSVIDFGYLFRPHLGIHSSFYFTTTVYTFTGIVAGPLLSKSIGNEKFVFDFRPSIGVGTAQYEVMYSLTDIRTENTKATFAFGLGGSMRWNVWERFSLSANLNYYYAKPKDIGIQMLTGMRYEEQDLSSFGISFGFYWRL